MIAETLFEDRERSVRIECVTIKFEPQPGERRPRSDRHFELKVGGAKIALNAAQMVALSRAFIEPRSPSYTQNAVRARVLDVLRGEGVL